MAGYLRGLAGILGLALWAQPVSAADVSPAAPPSIPAGWTYQATFYGWATALNGSVGVRNLPPATVDVTFGDILQHFSGAVMGSFLARNGDWMILTDLVWAQLSGDARLKVANEPSVKAKQRLLIASALAGYRLPLGNPDLDLSVTAGVRYQRLTLDATLTPGTLPFVDLKNEQTKAWLDPVVGLVVQYRINERWFLNALADIGGFGVGSQLTSQGVVSLGYNWTETISTAVGYRALYTDYKSSGDRTGTFRYDTTMHGPFVSLGIHF